MWKLAKPRVDGPGDDEIPQMSPWNKRFPGLMDPVLRTTGPRARFPRVVVSPLRGETTR
jgi:hypothetical protein